MLPMAMHQKQDRVKRKHKSISTTRSSRPSLEHMFPEEGVKSDENASDLENIVESKKSFCSAVLVSSPRTSRVSSPTRNLSITGDRVFTNSNHAKKSIDMRPLSVPPRNIKRNSSKQSYCYVALGIATIVVCGIAFTMWLTYDSLEKFISSMLN